MSSEDQARAKLRVQFQEKKPGYVGITITVDHVPDELRERIKAEVELHKHDPRYESIPHWHWEPIDEWADGRPLIEADKLQWIVPNVGAALVAATGSSGESARAAVAQLLEAELGGPLFPPGGSLAYLEAWAAKQ